MKVTTVTNGSVKLVVIPENEMEEKLLEELTNQDNEIVVAKEGIRIVDKQFPHGVIIQKKTGLSKSLIDEEEEKETDENAKEEETV